MESSPLTNMQPGPRSAEWGGLSRHLLSRVDELQEVLSKERQNYRTLKQLTCRLDEQLKTALSSEEEQRKSNKELQETLERVREELKTTQVQAEGVQQEAESLLQDSQELREANEKLQQKYAEAKEKLKRAAAAQKERKKTTEHREKRLRDKIELLEAKLEEQKLEVSLVKKNLSSCEQKYERKLNNLLQAKREFERLLFWGPGSDSSYATPSPGLREFPRVPTTVKEEHPREPTLTETALMRDILDLLARHPSRRVESN